MPTATSQMYAAIDDLMDKLNRQIARYKEKLQTHHVDTQKLAMQALEGQ